MPWLFCTLFEEEVSDDIIITSTIIPAFSLCSCMCVHAYVCACIWGRHVLLIVLTNLEFCGMWSYSYSLL